MPSGSGIDHFLDPEEAVSKISMMCYGRRGLEQQYLGSERPTYVGLKQRRLWPNKTGNGQDKSAIPSEKILATRKPQNAKIRQACSVNVGVAGAATGPKLLVNRPLPRFHRLRTSAKLRVLAYSQPWVRGAVWNPTPARQDLRVPPSTRFLITRKATAARLNPGGPSSPVSCPNDRQGHRLTMMSPMLFLSIQGPLLDYYQKFPPPIQTRRRRIAIEVPAISAPRI